MGQKLHKHLASKIHEPSLKPACSAEILAKISANCVEKKVSNPISTGGLGFSFENKIQAFFAVYMLSHTNLQEALSFFTNAADLLENKTIFPQSHPNVVWAYNFIATIQLALNQPNQSRLFFQKTLDACTKFKAQSTYFSLHSHQIEALVGLASLNQLDDPPLSQQQIKDAKEIQESRGIFKYMEKIAQIEKEAI